jgi:exoribonuclease R
MSRDSIFRISNTARFYGGHDAVTNVHGVQRRSAANAANTTATAPPALPSSFVAMPPLRYPVALDDSELANGFEAIRQEMNIPAFSAKGLAQAQSAAATGPVTPPAADPTRLDRTDVDLVAIDPPGSRDLDQAFGAERLGDGYRVHYAIADVAAFVAPGTTLEAESLERGVTLYAPDRRESLHPEIINEQAASLLPGETRPSAMWAIDLDGGGHITNATLTRTTVRVSQAMTYREAQAEIDGPDPRESLALLSEIGRHREQLERERGAVSLALPAQEIKKDEHGHSQLVYDETLAVEGWNAQISLLTGIAAADIMLEAGVGMLRTLPPPEQETIDGLRRTARGLQVEWPESESYADRVRDLDPNHPREVALLMRSARGLRGAGYASFISADQIPSQPQHSAIASTYAHVTAPLRRVCDRYANEVILAICGDREPPAWALEMLPELPSVMGRTRQREQSLERAVVDYMEAMVLQPSIGREFDAVVINHRRDQAIIQLRDPAVIAGIEPKPQLGQQIRVKLLSVDTMARQVQFERVS